jgi:3-hydroxymyristoyl/3-hydroxydecanoyl-(acyl carrier protein) dehydratase
MTPSPWILPWISQTSGAASTRVWEAVLPADSGWLNGHFPDDPVLPGAAMLAQVEYLAATVRSSSSPVAAVGYKRVKFRQMVRPGARLIVSIAPRQAASGEAFAFEMTAGGELCSSGVVAFVPTAKPLHAASRGPVEIDQPGNRWPMTDLLPHRPPALLVVDLLTPNAEGGVVTAVVGETWPMCESGQVSSVVLFDLVAQAAGAWAGWRARAARETRAPGYFAGVKNSTLYRRHVACGTGLTVRLRREAEVGPLLALHAKVRDETTAYAAMAIQALAANGSAGL